MTDTKTGLLARDHGQVVVRERCATYRARKTFNRIMFTNELDAEPGQKTCITCFKPSWEGTKFCEDCLRRWAPKPLCEASIKQLEDLFVKAEAEPQSPVGDPMAGILEKVELDESASFDWLNIDLEVSARSRHFHQIGICDSRREKQLNCLSVYSEGVTEELPTKNGFREVQHSSRGEHGGLTSLTSEWLDKENVTHNLAQNDNVCLLLNEFRENPKPCLELKCFRGRSFPLRLPVLLALLFR
ncbi:hypothetical protein N7456_007535 [Penicillium angulare]|uniref:Uncharacterized protein n=1 Tax=Penicillium angulare TaxID=116970 RepID=A0A9W9FB68_9EURO|nr:hypothetical protein N7456_007535 [Penicillium angulare]